ncbi:MAG: molybdopterin oxidoreductase family protein [Steroidobacteraceae bacterium]
MKRSAGAHYRSCHLCEAMCGVEIRTDGGVIHSIRGDEADPFSRGHVCAKAVALKDVQEDPDRLRRPLRRTETGWQEIGWKEALDEAARRLVEVQALHGRHAVATYFGNPQVHSYSALLSGAQFARSLRTHNRYSATSVDQLPHHFAAYFLYGHQLLLPVPDLDRTHYFLVLGANPVVSNGSLMTAPDVTRRLKALRARGGRLVTVDPRRSETARLADRHLPIRPGTDALFLLAMLQVLFEEKLIRPGRLEECLDGLDDLQARVANYRPEAVEGITGIEAGTLREVAREFAQAPSAVCYGRMGASTQAYGALTQWLSQLLNILTGNLDRPGGAMFSQPAVDVLGLTSGLGQGSAYARRRTRVSGLPEFSGEFPVAALAEEILTPGDGQVRALVTSAGNPVLSTPNGRRLEQALPTLDFMVSVDFYLNETTRHAHLILPPTFGLERDHYDLIFNLLAIRNTAKYSKPLFPRDGQARHDWEIFHGLTQRILRLRRGGSAWRERALARWATPRRVLAAGLRLGPYGAGWNPLRRGLTLSKLAREHPHGLDLGALKPCLPERLATPNRRINLAPEPLMQDLDRLDDRLTYPEPGRLLLIGRRDPRTNNSWMHNSRRLVKGPVRCTLLMHPMDAEATHLVDGQPVEVRSRTGAVQLPLEVSDDMMPGTVSIPHGWGHGRSGTHLSVANQHPGVSVNDLTDEKLVDELCGNAALSGVPVTVRAAQG